MLKAEKYATDPNYPIKLKRLLREYKNVTIVRPTQSSSSSSSSGPGIRNQSEGSKLAGELGRFLDSKGLGAFGSGVHQHPEHPLGLESLVTDMFLTLYTMNLKVEEQLTLEGMVQICLRER